MNNASPVSAEELKILEEVMNDAYLALDWQQGASFVSAVGSTTQVKIAEAMRLIKTLSRRSAASGAKVPEETILHLDSIVKFAYSHGFHELGYDPIATIRSCIAALTPAPVKEVPEDVRKDAELPPLPEPAYRTINGMGNPLIFFNSDDMRDYALAAIAASKGGKTG